MKIRATSNRWFEMIRADAEALKAESPTVHIVDNLDDPDDPWLEIRGLTEDELTQAERDLRQYPVRIRRADGTELMTLFMVGQPLLRMQWPLLEVDATRDADGTIVIVVP